MKLQKATRILLPAIEAVLRGENFANGMPKTGESRTLASLKIALPT